MKKIFLFFWQFPQNVLGLLVILFTKAMYNNKGFWFSTVYRFGVSLGNYIIFGRSVDEISLKHEKGHQIQSLYLGWLYLIMIGLLSVIGNIWDRLTHKGWSYERREMWYYNQPWERWADKLGGVKR